MNIVQHIPNTITCLNLLCGCLAVIAALSGEPLTGAFLIIFGAVLDFFDGFAARLLKVSSPIGKELDSLADVVTFGLAPGLILLQSYVACLHHDVEPNINRYVPTSLEFLVEYPLLIFPLLIPIFSALRLAKFNVDERQTMGFRGLPTPASALWCISVPLIQWYTPSYLPDMSSVVGSFAFIIASSIGLSALMVSDIPLMAMKFKSYSWKGNQLRFGFLISAMLLLIILQTVALPVILLLYVLVSIIQNKVQTA
jgi:CDP-diacylglycerol---serine O-phosphatidyltransferase